MSIKTATLNGVAPRILRTPISLVFSMILLEIMPSSPRQAITIDNMVKSVIWFLAIFASS